MKPQSITESIVEQLRIHIVGGALKPGQKLNESKLSSHFGVSRPPLREAFRSLENEKLVTSVSRKGSYVTDISLEDCQEIFEVREMIECAAIDLFKEKKINNLPEVAAVIKQTADLTVPTSSEPRIRFEYLMAIANFHIKLVESANNSRLTHFYNAISLSLARYQALYMYDELVMNRSKGVHQQILRSIKAGNYADAKKILRSHIRGFLEFMRNRLELKKASGIN